MSLFEKEFSRPTASDLTADSYTDFFNFSTGRRNVASLHTVFALRHCSDRGCYSPNGRLTPALRHPHPRSRVSCPEGQSVN